MGLELVIRVALTVVTMAVVAATAATVLHVKTLLAVVAALPDHSVLPALPAAHQPGNLLTLFSF